MKNIVLLSGPDKSKYFNGDVDTVGVFKTFKKIFPNINISLLDNRVSLEDGKIV